MLYPEAEAYLDHLVYEEGCSDEDFERCKYEVEEFCGYLISRSENLLGLLRIDSKQASMYILHCMNEGSDRSEIRQKISVMRGLCSFLEIEWNMSSLIIAFLEKDASTQVT